MRIMVKGGIWKNTEDEILKAAVMKYGKNQWARISSLLVRKTAKQCKTRWYEWLDPSIKKTDWSREEEEKLLHLAKIMPNQWRSIAPLVGRTASQCIEHYEKLLDAAQKDKEYTEAEDPRRLRPGEIDPNPESKAARPDPIDMDEDEKEMLSEARARLANTKGKKAKRKAREKQLEEARRLAAIQKRRELKAAGIELPKQRRKIKGIDYNREIPFQKRPAPGFYEVDFSDEKQTEAFKPVSLEVLEGKRKRDEEEDQRKNDSKKLKQKMEQDLPSVLAAIAKANDPGHMKLRPKLFLPSPQLSDKELEELAKMSEGGAPVIEEEGGEGPTNALLPDFGATPTPIRTPLPGSSATPFRAPVSARTPAREDTIMREARNFVALTAAETPLAGGDNPDISSSDFSSSLPKSKVIQTPNDFGTPLRGGGGATPLRGGKTPLSLSTPVRDSLSINKEDATSFEGRFEAKKKREEFLSSLRSGLSSLPAPQNEYAFELPDLPPPETEEKRRVEEEQGEEDASDILAKETQRREAEERRLKKLQSQVLQRGLPRPLSLPPLFSTFSSKQEDPLLKKAEEILREEMISLIISDSLQFPFRGCQIKTGSVITDLPTEGEMEAAKQMIKVEEEKLKTSYSSQGEFSFADFRTLSGELDDELSYLASKKKVARVNQNQKKERLEVLSARFSALKSQMEQEAAKAQKMEGKLNVYLGGYQNRAHTLLQQIQQLSEEIDEVSIELYSFKKLKELESLNIPSRIEGLNNLVKEQEDIEEENQKRYKNLLSERENLLELSQKA